ncbi:Threonine/homoserine/homoserine lactone efflux protein [Zhouia amylolytica]|uniref:Threonine/homoserine/homoserine lactone efflux protein n=2 Tax=Zhouia amylolytica TaxID=376730 RepID=A0A1I6PSE3_9FLAO|nr:LysE family transporter [Zhouia amylolytica]ETN94055.1 putative amino acid efflux protein ycgF [Zhouia amylolytica AD3]MCQ0112827.1 LysE family transporter [Zhouia amylolytica]SFS43119.1 Threonine/homoserine/homoserine lactone efflux protein [Zhouia amylolytica]
MTQDILSAIPWGILLAFTIGPVFFVLLETSALKGFRAGLALDVGVVLGDIFFILIAYFSTNKILERLKDEPALFIFGGLILLVYGVISFIRNRRNYRRVKDDELEDFLPKKNYLNLALKGFVLNFINIGVLGFWLGVIIVFGPKLDMNPNRIFVFIATILVTYLLVDCIKILLAKQLKSKLTPYRIFKIKRVISIVLMFFGFALIIQGFFPNEKEKLKDAIEDIRNR